MRKLIFIITAYVGCLRHPFIMKFHPRIFIIINFFLCLSLSFCAFNKSQNDITNRENKKSEEKNKLLRDTYDLVTGFYNGKLHLPNEDRNISLGVYTLEIKEGTNSSGEPLFKPTLKAVYRQLYPIEVPIVLDGRFVPETGELSFTNPNANISNEMIHTINATINGRKITGTAKTPTGTLGNIDLDFVQKHVEAPTEGDDENMAQKLREQYDLISGSYVGKIKRSGNSSNEIQNEWDVEVGIYTLEVKSGSTASGEAIFKPVLKAVFKQNYPIIPNILLDVQYIPESGQILFFNPSAGPDDLHTINAKLDGNVVDGIAKKSSGFWGTLHLELFSKNVNTPPSSDENELNRKIREQYKEISGTYKGKISKEVLAGEIPQQWQVELALYVLEVRNGSSPTGEPKFKPTLKALFKQLAPVVPNTLLDVQYIAETGQILFSNSQAGPEELNSITAQLNDKSINGTAQKSSGLWGKIDLQFLSKTVDTPASGDENELNRRLREQYEEISGTYKGKVVRESSNGQPKQEWAVELGLYVLEVKSGSTPTGEPKFKPTLKAVFKQISPVVPNSLLDVQYIAETGQILFSNSQASTNNLNSINARLKNKSIIGTATKSTGTWGNIQMNFTSKNVDTPTSGDEEDYNRRLTEEYKALVGTYKGTVSPTSGDSNSFAVEVKVFIVQETGANGSVIKLKAYYKRSSDRYGATDLTMNVDYKTELDPPGVDMSGERSNGGRTYFVVLNGTFQNKEIKGQYHDQRGFAGPFKLKFRGP
jgi:hypothetical protein